MGNMFKDTSVVFGNPILTMVKRATKKALFLLLASREIKEKQRRRKRGL